MLRDPCPPSFLRRIATYSALVSLAGCAQIVGIGDWHAGKGASSSSTGGTASTSTSTSTSGTGGAGGAPVVPDATCNDGIKNGLETDVDCGGDTCRPCALGKACANAADCASGNCKTGGCAAPGPKVCPDVDMSNPTCSDCVKNGSETGVDCGGDSCPPCAEGLACNASTDCASGNCDPMSFTCGPKLPPACDPVDLMSPTCTDCTMDGLETDIDCGGDTCPPCKDGHTCLVNADCVGHLCNGGICSTAQQPCPITPDPMNPTCADCVKNGQETDVDCGGDTCPPCSAGKQCGGDTDCKSGHCHQGACT